MPIDTSIYGMIRPQAQAPGPLDQYAQGMQVRALMDQGELSALQRQKLTQDMQEEQAFKDAVRATNGQLDEATVGRLMGVSPARAIQLQKMLLEGQQARSTIDKNKAETAAKNLALLRDQAAAVRDQPGWDSWREGVARLMGPDIAGRIPPQFSPEAQSQVIMTADKLAEQLKPHYQVVDLGGRQMVAQINPQAQGGATPLPAKTLTPEGRISAARLGLEQRRAAFEGIPGVAVGGGAGVAPAASGAVGGASPVPAPTAPKATGAAAVPAAAQQGALSPKAKMEANAKFVEGQLTNLTKNYEENVPKFTSGINAINEARAAMDSGMYSGQFAGAALTAAKTLAENVPNRFVPDELKKRISNTETYAAATGQLVLNIIKNLGSGSGISDADREYAAKIVGGQITLNPQTFDRLLSIAERGIRAQANIHNANVDSAAKQGFAPAYDIKFNLPPTYQKKDKGAGKIQTPTRISGDDGYNALPSGELFIGPDGVTRRKP